ncbi:hypothetical protein LVJ83_04620 [Uruburuella testudinis]|uniref:DUF6900 domain-containing protein n=1 Tax=Uruburuella testudinis TaxID=1282863 RepID=A0ABY4DYS6_9NEIS|nr:hypothetical protein [Uruburuella testudinis]UOO82752.1 hypothetical protein LVJ83_04620 [Uruburuella testudinis]
MGATKSHNRTAPVSLLATIAAEELFIENLQTQNSGADFHEVSVGCVASALKAAYEAGYKAAQSKNK